MAKALSSKAGSGVPGWAVLLLLCAAQFMVVLDFSIVNVALPSIQQAFGLTQEQLQWIVSAYALTFGGLLLLGGRAADLYGRRRMFVIGLVLFAVASLLGGVAPSAWLLEAARGLQGVAAAVLSPAALSLVSTTFSEGRERNRAFGIYSALGASGFAIGVFLGGLLTDGPGWRWVFFVNVPVGLVVALLASKFLAESRRETASPHLDLPGAVSATGGFCLLVYGLTTAAAAGWTAWSTWAWVMAGLVCLVAFAAIEARSPSPLMPLRLLRRRRLVLTDVAMLLTSASIAPQVFVMTLYLQEVEGYSAAQTGFLLLVQGASAVLGAAVGSRGVSRFGLRPMLVGGRAAAAAALGLLAFALSNESTNLPALVGALALIGLGNVATFVAISIGATSGVESGDVGLASGLLYTAQQIGAALGLSALVALAATRTSLLEAGGVDASTALVEGLRYALAGAALMSGLAAVVGLALPADVPAPQSARAEAGRPASISARRASSRS